jgi:hypothetical protein
VRVMADTEPLISTEGSPAPEDENFLPDVIFFLGKELRTGMGMRQSFIRKPGTEQVLVRIGIGRDGVFKVDGMENKILDQWAFSDLKDWSFSGYSFTLQFHASNRNYSVRTDDGEAICSYIDDFQKHPEQALVRDSCRDVSRLSRPLVLLCINWTCLHVFSCTVRHARATSPTRFTAITVCNAWMHVCVCVHTIMQRLLITF